MQQLRQRWQVALARCQAAAGPRAAPPIQSIIYPPVTWARWPGGRPGRLPTSRTPPTAGCARACCAGGTEEGQQPCEQGLGQMSLLGLSTDSKAWSLHAAQHAHTMAGVSHLCQAHLP